jgi:hypothetical protein
VLHDGVGDLVEVGHAATASPATATVVTLMEDWRQFGYWGEHPNPTDADIREVCEAWVRYQAKSGVGQDDGDDPDWWGVQAVLTIGGGERPDIEWSVVRGICSLADPADDNTIGMIGAGPLEHFIEVWGDTAMDLIEPAATSAPILLEALRSVWAFREPVRPRIDRFLAAHPSN